MSYDIYLVHPVSGEVLETDEPHQLRGGTYQLGGTTRLHLNITYNYAKHFCRVFPQDAELEKWSLGVRWLYGRQAAETVSVLKEAISKLENDVSSDYWEPTEGNAKMALYGLLAMAHLRPDGVWKGD